MAMAGHAGAEIDLEGAAGTIAPHAFLFGEDQARYVIAVAEADAKAVETEARRAEVTLTALGTGGGDALKLGTLATISIADLRARHEAWLPDYMAADL
jgi:phosphoribosylformylglycinamidine synthase